MGFLLDAEAQYSLKQGLLGFLFEVKMFKSITHLVLVAFLAASLGPMPQATAQTLIDLPAPGMMVNRSGLYEPLELKGIMVNIKEPLRFKFLIDKGNSNLAGQSLTEEITRLSKYFLTCLAVPEDDLWVNLSPYEKDRIIPGNFGITLMGKDLLEQDYLLKQIMASLSFPENEIGKHFWDKVYQKAYQLYGTTEIPINTFNKVWILPQSAIVYVHGNSAFVVKAQLDVMLEADYKSYVMHLNGQMTGSSQKAGAYSQIFRDVILPELRQEVNEGKNFAVVRQVYNAMILATWYKRHLRNTLLARSYVGKDEVNGVDIVDQDTKEKIFQQYLKAYKKCVYNFVKEDVDPLTQQVVPHKYASGGVRMRFTNVKIGARNYREETSNGPGFNSSEIIGTIDLTPTNESAAMISHVGNLARKMLMPMAALVLLSISSSAFAEKITPMQGGKILHLKVLKGDTLIRMMQHIGFSKEELFRNHGKAIKEIAHELDLKNPNRIYIGQDLYVHVFKPTRSTPSKKVATLPAPKISPTPVVTTPSVTTPVVPQAPVVVTPAPAPTDLTVAKAASNMVTLSWKAPPSTSTAVSSLKYVVEKSASHDGPFAPLTDSIGITSTIFTDTHITNPINYYRVKAINDGKDSLFSAIVAAQSNITQAAGGSAPPPPPDDEQAVKMTFVQAIQHIEAYAGIKIGVDQKESDALNNLNNPPTKDGLIVGFQGYHETAPNLNLNSIFAKYTTAPFFNLTRNHDKRQGPINDQVTALAKQVLVRQNVIQLIVTLQQMLSTKAHIQRLQAASNPDLADEINRSQNQLRHQQFLISSIISRSMHDRPSGSTIDIIDAENVLKDLQTYLSTEGINLGEVPQATQAGLDLWNALESVHGQLETSQLPASVVDFPSSLTLELDLKSLRGAWYGVLTPNWTARPAFKTPDVVKAVNRGTAQWQVTLQGLVQQVIQLLSDLHDAQSKLADAEKAWDARSKDADADTVIKLSRELGRAKDAVDSLTGQGMNIGVPADMLQSPGDVKSDAVETFARGAFKDNQDPVLKEAQALEINFTAHPGKNKEMVIKPAVDHVIGVLLNTKITAPNAADVPAPVDSTDPTSDPTLGQKLATPTINGGSLNNFSFSYIRGSAPSDPNAPFWNGNAVNVGDGLAPVWNLTGFSAKTQDIDRQQQGALNYYKDAHQGNGDGPISFRLALYGYAAAGLTQEAVNEGQGLALAPAFSLNTSYPFAGLNFFSHDFYFVAEPVSFDMFGYFKKQVYDPKIGSKLSSRNKEQRQADDIATAYQMKQWMLRVTDAIIQAKKDTSSAEYKAWKVFFDTGKSPFIMTYTVTVDNDKKEHHIDCPEMQSILEALRQQLKPLWESTAIVEDELPLGLQLAKLDLEAAKKLLDSPPSYPAVFLGPLTVLTNETLSPGFSLGNTSINLANRKRAHNALYRKWLNSKLAYERALVQWQLSQAEVKPKAHAAEAVANIAAHQTERAPFDFEAGADTDSLKIAEAVGQNQTTSKIRTLMFQKGKLTDPRTFTAGAQWLSEFSPSAQPSNQIYYVLSLDWYDYGHGLINTEKHTFDNQLQQEADEEGAAAIIDFNDNKKQQGSARLKFQQADAEYKASFAKWEEISQGVKAGKNTKEELAQVEKEKNAAQERYQFYYGQLETASLKLFYYVSMLPQKLLTSLGIALTGTSVISAVPTVSVKPELPTATSSTSAVLVMPTVIESASKDYTDFGLGQRDNHDLLSKTRPYIDLDEFKEFIGPIDPRTGKKFNLTSVGQVFRDNLLTQLWVIDAKSHLPYAEGTSVLDPNIDFTFGQTLTAWSEINGSQDKIAMINSSAPKDHWSLVFEEYKGRHGRIFWKAALHKNGAASLSSQTSAVLNDSFSDQVQAAVGGINTQTVSGMVDSANDHQQDFAEVAAEHKRNGGITMNSRLLELDTIGENTSNFGYDGNNSLPAPIIKGVIPLVSGIVEVTPEMLKVILGTGYLN